MRLLMVVPQQFYSTRGTPLSAYHRARELENAGLSVDVLTYGVGEEPPELRGRLYRARGPHFIGTIKPGPSLMKIWFDFLLFVALFFRLTRDEYQVLYGHEEGGFLCRLAGAIFDTPYVYDMHSSLPRQITEWKFSERNWVVRLFSWVEAMTIGGAAAVVAISPAVAEVAREVDEDASVITVVNFFDDKGDEYSLTPEQVRDRHQIDPVTPLIVYTGSFVALQALDLLLESVPAVIEEIEDAHFLLVGGTSTEIEGLTPLIAELDIERSVSLLAARPQAEMPAYMKAADVLVSPRVRGINPPGKLFSYLASGKPVVATDTLVHNQLLSSDCAVLTAPNPAALAEGLVEALTNSVLRQEVLEGAGLFLEEYCSPVARKRAYGSIIAALESAAAGG